MNLKVGAKRFILLLLAFMMIVGQIEPAAAVTFVISAEKQETSETVSPDEEQPAQEEQSSQEEQTSQEESADPEADAQQEEDAAEPEQPEEVNGEETAGEEASGEETAREEASEEKEQPQESVSTEKEKQSQESVSTEEVVEQTIPASVGKDRIELSGEMPDGAEVEVSKAKKAAEKAGLENVLCAYDITINEGWQPEEAIEVSIRSKDITDKNVLVYHITEDGEAEEVEVLTSKKGQVSFEAEGFSIYAVTENVYRRTYEFYEWRYDAWLPYEFDLLLPGSTETNPQTVHSNKQVLKNGDELALPSMPDRDGQQFIGWYDSPDGDVNQLEAENGGVKDDINQDGYVELYARYGRVKYITFYSAPQKSGNAETIVFNTRRVIIPDDETSHVVDISQEPAVNPPDKNQVFMGWTLAGDTPEPVDTEHFTVYDDVALYPIFSGVHWITFTSPMGSRATYVAPISVPSDNNTIAGKLIDIVPTRPGYIFKGWKLGETQITDAKNNLLNDVTITTENASMSNGVLTVTKDITLESDWTALETTYNVVFWQEKASDTKKLVKTGETYAVPEEQKEYEYLATQVVTGMSGAKLTGNELLSTYGGYTGSQQIGDRTYSFTGMQFNCMKDDRGDLIPVTDAESVTIAGDKSTVVNVYYDRQVVSYTFDFPDDVTSQYDIPEEKQVNLPGVPAITQELYNTYRYGNANGNYYRIHILTSVKSADYPQDYSIYGLYGGKVSDGKTDDQHVAQWPSTYQVNHLSYDYVEQGLQISRDSNNTLKWYIINNQTSNHTYGPQDTTLYTYWHYTSTEASILRERFTGNVTFSPGNGGDLIRRTIEDGDIITYKEDENDKDPATYSTEPEVQYDMQEGYSFTAGDAYQGFVLDHLTYVDKNGNTVTVNRDSAESSITLSTDQIRHVRLYHNRKTYNIEFYNEGTHLNADIPVKYDLPLDREKVYNHIPTPEFPTSLGDPNQYEFVGWFLDKEHSIYVDFAGLTTSQRRKLMRDHDEIHEIVSIRNRRIDGQMVEGLRMPNGNLPLYAGWLKKWYTVQVDPGKGQLQDGASTFFWLGYNEVISQYNVSRNYTPAKNEASTKYYYHIHTYDQYLEDEDSQDRQAYYTTNLNEPKYLDKTTPYQLQEGAYDFLGWFRVKTDADGNETEELYNFDTRVTEDVKLRARWSRKGTYTIVYEPGVGKDKHGELIGSPNDHPVLYHDHANVYLQNCIQADTGYVFTGWKVKKPYTTTGELLDRLYVSGDTFEMNADSAWMTREYTEENGLDSNDDNEGVIYVVAQYKKMVSSSITYDKNAAGAQYTGDQPAGLTAYYGPRASYSKTENGYTVTGIEQNANIRIDDGNLTGENAFFYENHKLMGWSYTPDGGVDVDLDQTGYKAPHDLAGEGHTLYAVWQAERDVVYHLKGGTWSSENGAAFTQNGADYVFKSATGETVPIPVSPSKEGAAFAGWALTEDGDDPLLTAPTVKNQRVDLYAVWETDHVAINFDLKGGTWDDSPYPLVGDGVRGTTVPAGSTLTLNTKTPEMEGAYIFYKWEYGTYQYNAGSGFKTSVEQKGQTLVLDALWGDAIEVALVKIHRDDRLEVDDSSTIKIGASPDGSLPFAPEQLEGYQYLFTVYDEVLADKEDVVDRIRVKKLSVVDDTHINVTMNNGTVVEHHTTKDDNKLFAVYIEDRPVNVYLKQLGSNDLALETSNLVEQSAFVKRQITVGATNLEVELPSPLDYAKPINNGDGNGKYRIWCYGIGKEFTEGQPASDVNALDTMNKGSIYLRQTLNSFEYSLNGKEWVEVSRDTGDGKNFAVYIIYDTRLENKATIIHRVTGTKADKEQLFNYSVSLKGRNGFLNGKTTYFTYKAEKTDTGDRANGIPNETLNRYETSMQDGGEVVMPLHISKNGTQTYQAGTYYNMDGQEKYMSSAINTTAYIWQEALVTRKTAIDTEHMNVSIKLQYRQSNNGSYTDDTTTHYMFNSYDTANYEWIRQLGVTMDTSKYLEFEHIFQYTRTSIDVPVHVVELTRDGFVDRDDCLRPGVTAKLSVNKDDFTTVDSTTAANYVDTSVFGEPYSLCAIKYGLDSNRLSGDDSELHLNLTHETGDKTLLHVYDYASGDPSSERTMLIDDSAVYFVYYKNNTTVPVEYVKKDSAGVYNDVRLAGYQLTNPTVTVGVNDPVQLREEHEGEQNQDYPAAGIVKVNKGVNLQDAIYVTGRMFVVDENNNILATYEPNPDHVWSNGASFVMRNSVNGLQYVAPENAAGRELSELTDGDYQPAQYGLKIWVEVADNIPLDIVGRLYEKGAEVDRAVKVVNYLPKPLNEDGTVNANGAVVADGTSMRIQESFTGYSYISFDPEKTTGKDVRYERSLLGEDPAIYSVAYETGADGYRYWSYQSSQTAEPVRLPNETLYADYYLNPVTVPVFYVVQGESGYQAVADADIGLAHPTGLAKTLSVQDGTGTALSSGLTASVAAVDGSANYRTTGVYAFGPETVGTAYATTDNLDSVLTNTFRGISYPNGENNTDVNGNMAVYVVMKRVNSLTITERINDAGGYAVWDDAFTYTIQLSGDGYAAFGETLTANVTSDTTVDHAQTVDISHPDVVFTNGRATVTLKHGQSIEIPGLPNGAGITIAQEATQGSAKYSPAYSVTTEGGSSTSNPTFTLEGNTTVTVTSRSISVTETGGDFADQPAYGLLICGGLLYGLYVYFRRKREEQA